MKKLCLKLWRDEKGANALEFALISPVMIIALIGIFNIGYAIHCGGSVRNAMERSSRTLIANPSATAATLKTKALTMLSTVPVENLAVTVTTETVTGQVQVKRVAWTYDFMLWIPLLDDHSLAMGSSVVVPLATTT